MIGNSDPGSLQRDECQPKGEMDGGSRRQQHGLRWPDCTGCGDGLAFSQGSEGGHWQVLKKWVEDKPRAGLNFVD